MVSASGKYDLQLNITKFNADKNDFCRKFSAVSTAKDFVGKFRSTHTTDVMASTSGASDSVTVSEETPHISGDEEEIVVKATGQKTPKTLTKKKKRAKKRKQPKQMPEGAELPSPEKVPKANSLDEEIEAHYIGMLT